MGTRLLKVHLKGHVFLPATPRRVLFRLDCAEGKTPAARPFQSVNKYFHLDVGPDRQFVRQEVQTILTVTERDSVRTIRRRGRELRLLRVPPKFGDFGALSKIVLGDRRPLNNNKSGFGRFGAAGRALTP